MCLRVSTTIIIILHRFIQDLVYCCFFPSFQVICRNQKHIIIFYLMISPCLLLFQITFYSVGFISFVSFPLNPFIPSLSPRRHPRGIKFHFLSPSHKMCTYVYCLYYNQTFDHIFTLLNRFQWKGFCFPYMWYREKKKRTPKAQNKKKNIQSRGATVHESIVDEGCKKIKVIP